VRITHIAGIDVTIGPRLRQRCAWCGATLIDYDLERVAVPVGQEGPPGTWEIGALVQVDGNMTIVLDHDDQHHLPDDACGKLDPEVTK
jgi:hypothetical protein